MIIIQGNTYDFPVKLKIKGNYISSEEVKRVEFSFENVKKTYPEDVTFNNDCFIVTLSQSDTLSLSSKKVCKYHVRVAFNDGRVKSTEPIEFAVVQSESREVL